MLVDTVGYTLPSESGETDEFIMDAEDADGVTVGVGASDEPVNPDGVIDANIVEAGELDELGTGKAETNRTLNSISLFIR